MSQFYGSVKVDDFASASEADDYIFDFGVDGGSADLKEQVGAFALLWRKTEPCSGVWLLGLAYHIPESTLCQGHQ